MSSPQEAAPQPTSRLAPTPHLPPLMGQPPSTGSSQRPRSSSHASHDSHGSDSSHSSHSSVQARKREEAFGTSQLPSVAKPAWSLLGILAVVTACHAAALYLFTSGFLLTRTEVKGVSECGFTKAEYTSPPPSGASAQTLLSWSEQHSQQCSLPPAFDRTLFLIIDALRYDFIAPIDDSLGQNFTRDPFHHGHFTLPTTIDRNQPSNSLLAHFLSDAPTTTLQRLKGLTTGSLPTFIDAGSNFGAEAIGEDNWIAQYRSHILQSQNAGDGPSMGFVGDDTWMKVYPHLFDANWTWPFDSFNVEDLHTVDDGVEKHLMPFLRRNPADGTTPPDWRLLIAHTLGLDHVGHRHTPSHPLMAAKLQQMDTFVKSTVDLLPPRTLFILAGDHGMDVQGDHGGESELEVGAALWLYSKAGFSGGDAVSSSETAAFQKDLESLRAEKTTSPDHLFGPGSHRAFSPLGQSATHRSVPQVDLVPTVSLLLGLPVPFGNLGTIVPEVFTPDSTASEPSRLLSALRINAKQIRHFLHEYSRNSTDFASFATELEEQYIEAIRTDAAAAARLQGKRHPDEEYYFLRREAMVAYQRYNRLALSRARSLWTAFSYGKIALGLASLFLAIVATSKVISVSRKDSPAGTHLLAKLLAVAFAKGAVVAGLIAVVALLTITREASTNVVLNALQGLSWVDALMASTSGGSLAILAMSSPDDGPSSAQQVKAEYEASKDGKVVSASKRSKAAKKRQTATPAESKTVVTQRHSNVWANHILPLSPVFLHAAIFASNSLTVWEDAIVHALLSIVLVVRAWYGWSLGSQMSTCNISPVGASSTSAPGQMENTKAIAHRARQRIPFLLGISAVLLRLIKVIGVCREEQAPSCTESFFHLRPLSSLLAPSQEGTLSAVWNWLPTVGVLFACYASSYILPFLLIQFLRQSKSDTSLVKFWADWIFRPTLMLGSGWWVIDWIGEALTASQQNGGGASSGNGVLQWGKNLLARVDFALILVVGVAVWFFAPLCLEVKEEAPAPTPTPRAPSSANGPPSPPMTAADQRSASQRRVQLLGFSNVFGSSYLLFVTLIFSLVWIVSPPASQLSLAALFVVLLSLSEAGDGERDLLALSRMAEDPQARPSTILTRTPGILETTTLHLLAHSIFFSTGHQATFLSIQWRTAFIGFSTVTYPWAPILVSLNTFGPSLLLVTIAVPLLLSWNLPPTPRGPTSRPMKSFRSLLIASLSFILATSIVTFSTAVFATHFRRHLMLFKIWAPRYMTSAVGLLGVDVAVLIAAAAWSLIASKVAQSLGTEFE